VGLSLAMRGVRKKGVTEEAAKWGKFLSTARRESMNVPPSERTGRESIAKRKENLTEEGGLGKKPEKYVLL